MSTSRRYTVEMTRQAEKEFSALRADHAETAARAIVKLETDPYAGHTLSGSLRGARSLEFNLKGSGAYRAVYKIINDECVCLIFMVGSHENIYREAEKRYERLRKRGEF